MVEASLRHRLTRPLWDWDWEWGPSDTSPSTIGELSRSGLPLAFPSARLYE